MSRGASSVDAGVYVTPEPAAVARLVASHGLDAAAARWHWMGSRTLLTMAQQARAASGVASTIRRSRTYSDEDAAVAVEAGFFLGSIGRGERAAGMKTANSARSIVFSRGLAPPAITPEERGRASSLGHAANSGDPSAIAERDARLALEQAVGSVLRTALSLVPSQPATGRYRLPPCDDAPRAALAGEPPEAVALVLPDLAQPAPEPVTEQEIAMPVRAYRKLPPDAQMASLHASGASVVAVAAMLNVSPQSAYSKWIRLGLPTRGRWNTATPAAERIRAVAPAPELVDPVTVPAPAPAPVPVPVIDAEAAPADGPGLLSLDDLALAVRLSKAEGISPPEAIGWVRLNRVTAEDRWARAVFERWATEICEGSDAEERARYAGPF